MPIEQISEHIDELALTNPHIDKVVKINALSYKLYYTPIEIDSIHKNHPHQLSLLLTEDYPDSAPVLKFVEPIFHPNVDQKDGTIHMPILHEEWSPFLTLNSLIESLDAIMEQPNASHVAEKSIFELYEESEQEYHAQVLNSIKQEQPTPPQQE